MRQSVSKRWQNTLHWPIWSLRRPVLATVLTVEVVTIAATAATLSNFSIKQIDWLVFGLLAAASVAHMEFVRGIERMREGARVNAPYGDLKSVWTFAGLLLLPPVLAAGLIVLTCLHLRVRIGRMQTFRWLYSSATVLLGNDAATAVLYAGVPHAGGTHPGLPTTWQGVGVIILAAALRWFINLALVSAVILLSSPKATAQEALGGLGNLLVEIAALSLGAITAVLVTFDRWYLVLLLPPLVALHRSLMLGQYKEAARTDAKTGLANASHWSDVARTELARAERDGTSVGVIMLDLDFFKRINDSYGHMTGDAVLTTVATALRKEARDYDLIGRFGGEEFMILLPDTDPTDLPGVAERFRHCINGLLVVSPDNHKTVTVTASAGVVAFPSGGSDLDELLLAADAALYKAKETGRNRTCVAPTLVAEGIPETRTGTE
jgi:diguanylate cyclase (GGDEF)-like protein